jgi:hypothetical protein
MQGKNITQRQLIDPLSVWQSSNMWERLTNQNVINWEIKSRLIEEMLAAIKFRNFCLLPCCLGT